MDRKELEIMAPAGSFDCLLAAIQGGADSVYFGIGPHPVLRLPRLACPGVKVRNMVAGLIAVDVTSDQAVLSDVLVLGVGIFRKIIVEELVKGGYELLLSSHEVHDPVHILGGMEAEIQRVPFDKALINGLHDVKILLESAVFVFRAGETKVGVENIPVI